MPGFKRPCVMSIVPVYVTVRGPPLACLGRGSSGDLGRPDPDGMDALSLSSITPTLRADVLETGHLTQVRLSIALPPGGEQPTRVRHERRQSLRRERRTRAARRETRRTNGGMRTRCVWLLSVLAYECSRLRLRPSSTVPGQPSTVLGQEGRRCYRNCVSFLLRSDLHAVES